jgi:hypothetical protein
LIVSRRQDNEQRIISASDDLRGLGATGKKIGSAWNDEADHSCRCSLMRARRLVRHVPKRSMTRAHSRKRLPINQMSAIDDARDCGGADAGLARYFIESRMFSFLDHCISTEDGSENEGLSLRCVRGNVQQLFGAEANVSCKAVQQYGLDQIA